MDIVTYVLCKNLVSKAATGIKKIEVDENGDLIFTMADGSTIKVDMPIKTDCVDFVHVDSLPISGIEENRVYVVHTALVDEENNPIYRQYMWVDSAWKFIGISGTPIATTEQVGLVKPDGKTLDIDTAGTLSVDIDYTYSEIETKIQKEEGRLTTDEDVDELFN